MSVIPKRRRRKAEINIVPLVDVLVVLIFFFLVSMQFRNLNLLNNHKLKNQNLLRIFLQNQNLKNMKQWLPSQ